MTKKAKNLSNIYILGNPLLKEDSLPLKLLPELKKSFKNINFIELDPTENLPEEKELILIDTIINTDKVKILTDIEKIQSSPQCSLHDFDLGFQLKLMKKLKKIDKPVIIGVPSKENQDKILKELKNIIPNLLSKND